MVICLSISIQLQSDNELELGKQGNSLINKKNNGCLRTAKNSGGNRHEVEFEKTKRNKIVLLVLAKPVFKH